MIIGISGRKQSGKNTIANFLSYMYYSKSMGFEVSYLDFKFIYNHHEFIDIFSSYTLSFADSLKEMVSGLTGCERDELEKEEFKNSIVPVAIIKGKDFTYRQLLQFIGTDIFRKYVDNDIWINLTMDKAKKENFCIIPDVRFENEAKSILKNKGCLIRVERNTIDNSDKHKSEIELDDYNEFDIIINNNGDLEELYNKVEQFIKENKLF